jgi:hypothetical protein
MEDIQRGRLGWQESDHYINLPTSIIFDDLVLKAPVIPELFYLPLFSLKQPINKPLPIAIFRERFSPVH